MGEIDISPSSIDTWNPDMCDIDHKPYLMGLIFGVWIEQILVVPN